MPDLNKSNGKNTTGVKYEYLSPVQTSGNDEASGEPSVDTSSVDLSDLMSKLKSL